MVSLNNKVNSLDEVDLTSVNSAISVLSTKVDALSTIKTTEVSVAANNSEGYSLTKAEHEDQVTENKALELATESVMSKDFKKAVFTKLNASVPRIDIESYKDITEVVIVESDTDDNEVKFEVKVYFYTDDDEDNTMKVYLNDFTVVVDDLDFDEDFEDAEVDDSYLTGLVIDKVKEI